MKKLLFEGQLATKGAKVGKNPVFEKSLKASHLNFRAKNGMK